MEGKVRLTQQHLLGAMLNWDDPQELADHVRRAKFCCEEIEKEESELGGQRPHMHGYTVCPQHI